jgi:uncharacterized protein with von Willebrand factor type A (vWA) domain
VFIEFFFTLKSYGIPVSLHEWITLHKALVMNLHDCSLTNFYHIGRSILVKNEIYFDKYDMAFLDIFKDIETTDEMLEKILDGLKKVKELNLTEEEKRQIDELDLDQVLKNFEEQLKEKHYKEHVGGNKAIGTGVDQLRVRGDIIPQEFVLVRVSPVTNVLFKSLRKEVSKTIQVI